MTLVATIDRTLQRLTKALMVICVLFVAAGPMADTFLCDPESGEVGSVQLVADVDGGGDRETPEPDHAICAHGHCHHLSPLSGSTDVHAAAMLDVRVERALLAAPEPPSAGPSSLKRPPRV
jgi:hypothetical protein